MYSLSSQNKACAELLKFNVLHCGKRYWIASVTCLNSSLSCDKAAKKKRCIPPHIVFHPPLCGFYQYSTFRCTFFIFKLCIGFFCFSDFFHFLKIVLFIWFQSFSIFGITSDFKSHWKLFQDIYPSKYFFRISRDIIDYLYSLSLSWQLSYGYKIIYSYILDTKGNILSHFVIWIAKWNQIRKLSGLLDYIYGSLEMKFIFSAS